MAKTKVMIVDDHAVVRRGLHYFLVTQQDLEIVGEAENGQEAVSAAEKLRPDVILMDLFMPLMNGIEAVKAILERLPETKIIMLTSFSDQDHVLPAIQAGASGYLLKDVQPEELAQAIRGAADGQPQLHPKAAGHLMAHLTAPAAKAAPGESLTARETEVLRMIAKGKSNKEIAAAFHITEKTVKTHVSNLLGKLGFADRTQAAIYAVKNGLSE